MIRRLIAIGYALGLAGPVAFLCRCSANPPEERVVFFGASITEDWPLKGYFPGRPYLNRGQGGELAFQMLARFQRDVVDLKPRAVVLKLCAINFGPTAPTLGVTKAEYREMIERAQAAGIKPVLATVVPVSQAWADRKGPNVQAGILAFGGWVKDEGRKRRLEVADYHTALADAEGFVNPRYSTDGLHVSPAGYALMTKVVGPAIDTTLHGRRPPPKAPPAPSHRRRP
ncbi:MAG: capsular biosynthesis protein [Deltaproteobacteria bacterium]|nr:capsular biosynthesis protein [Deltaproteobacteria bacterium]